jgi:penicillin-binding protein 2
MYLFDPAGAMKKLEAFETQWGGSLAERTARRAVEIEAISKANQAAASRAAGAL